MGQNRLVTGIPAALGHLCVLMGSWYNSTPILRAASKVLKSPLVTTGARSAQKLSGKGQHYPCLMTHSIVTSRTTAP